MNDHQLVHQLCRENGVLQDFPAHRVGELVKLCQEFAKRKSDLEVEQAVRGGLGRETVLYLKRIGAIAR
jgi:hypothetical protein